MFLPALSAVVAALFLIAAWTDVRTMRIPNWISLLLILLWMVRIGAAHLDITPLSATWHLDMAWFAGVFVALFICWAMRLLGAGDVKIIAAGCLWFGHPCAFDFLTMTGLAGGVIALVVMLVRRTDNFVLVYFPQFYVFTSKIIAFALPAFQRNQNFPYGAAIAVGALYAVYVQYEAWGVF